MYLCIIVSATLSWLSSVLAIDKVVRTSQLTGPSPNQRHCPACTDSRDTILLLCSYFPVGFVDHSLQADDDPRHMAVQLIIDGVCFEAEAKSPSQRARPCFKDRPGARPIGFSSCLIAGSYLIVGSLASESIRHPT